MVWISDPMRTISEESPLLGSLLPSGSRGNVPWHAAPNPGHLVAGCAEEKPEGASEARNMGEKGVLVHMPGVGEGPGEEKTLGWWSRGCGPKFRHLSSAPVWLSASV